jgi:hypothetical protein
VLVRSAVRHFRSTILRSFSQELRFQLVERDRLKQIFLTVRLEQFVSDASRVQVDEPFA